MKGKDEMWRKEMSWDEWLEGRVGWGEGGPT